MPVHLVLKTLYCIKAKHKVVKVADGGASELRNTCQQLILSYWSPHCLIGTAMWGLKGQMFYISSVIPASRLCKS